MSYRIVRCPSEVLVGDALRVEVERLGKDPVGAFDWIGLYPVVVPSMPGLSHGRWRYLSTGDQVGRSTIVVTFPAASSALPGHGGVFELRVHCDDQYGDPVCKSHAIHFVDAPISRAGRAGLLLVFLCAVQLMQLALNSKGGCEYLDPAVHSDVIWDWFSVATAPLNRLFVARPELGELAQAASSLLLDAGVLLLAFCASVRRSSVRSYCALFLFFTLRFVAQLAATLPCPPGFIWPRGRVAGVAVPTLFIDYHVANDFFFSGHVGTAAVVALELHQLGLPRAALLFLLFVLPFVALVVVAFRAHRGIDCIAALLAALASSSIAESVARALDRALQLKRKKPIL